MHALHLNQRLIDVTGKFDDKWGTMDEGRGTRKNAPKGQISITVAELKISEAKPTA
jgi:hypothetical protein